MFLGGSRIAQKAIEKLGDQYRIKVIEENKERCNFLADRFENVLVINGDGRNLDLLREEGLAKMDAFIATTGSSEVNLLMSPGQIGRPQAHGCRGGEFCPDQHR